MEPKKRGRPPKVEGAVSESHLAAIDAHVAKGVTYAATLRPDPVPGDNGAALQRIVEYFKAEHPDKWEAMRLCSLHNGLEDMIACLRS